MEIKELYLRKGEIITQLELLNEELAQINQKIGETLFQKEKPKNDSKSYTQSAV